MTALVHLDCNATTRPEPAVVREMVDCLHGTWANPSSIHGPGQAARRLLAQARARVAQLLGCTAAELVFTSGATEANHAALIGAAAYGARASAGAARRRLVLSAVEHGASLALAERLRAQGQPVDLIPVQASGGLDLAAAAALIGDDVALVSVMGANNETGVLMPIPAIARMAHAAGALLHVDATQWLGKTDHRFDAGDADLWSVSAHKIGGPKGVGALVVRKGTAWPPLLAGRQERNRRGGTENLPGIVGFAAAAERTRATLAADIVRLRRLQARLERGLRACCGDSLHVYGQDEPRLPNTTCLRFGHLHADQVLARLEAGRVVAASGAACSAGADLPSHVLLAMGEPPALARAAVRFSTDRHTSEAEIDHAVAVAARVLAPLLRQERAAVPPNPMPLESSP